MQLLQAVMSPSVSLQVQSALEESCWLSSDGNFLLSFLCRHHHSTCYSCLGVSAVSSGLPAHHFQTGGSIWPEHDLHKIQVRCPPVAFPKLPGTLGFCLELFWNLGRDATVYDRIFYLWLKNVPLCLWVGTVFSVFSQLSVVDALVDSMSWLLWIMH